MVAEAGAVLVRHHDGWAELVLNRPERRNAIISETVDLLSEGLTRLGGDESVRAVVLRGEGGVFCSGLDLQDPPSGKDFSRRWADLHRSLAAFPAVVVGALEKAAVAGGASLALACDVLVVGQGAFLSVPEVELARQAPMNVAWLVYKYGVGRALQLVLTGRRLSADTLLEGGLAYETVADAYVRTRSEELARTLAAFDRETVVQLKASIRDAAPRSFDEILHAVA